MKRDERKGLQLKRETLRNLNRGELKQAAGGGASDNGESCWNSCLASCCISGGKGESCHCAGGGKAE